MYFITIISFVFIKHIFAQGPGAFEIREHSLTRPYPSVFSTSHSHWYLTGNTIVTDRYIRLTSDIQSKAGGLWNTIPVSYPDWEMHVQFKVHGGGTSLFGDGFVIWYVRDAKLSGPVFGYADYFNGLGIMMDTYSNRNDNYNHIYPYISAVVNNGSLHYDNGHDGADINIAGCEASFRGREIDTLVAIRYQNNHLTVSTDFDGTNTWTECFSIENIHLPTHYYFGFSAATGELSDNHDIISVHTYQLDSSEQRQKEDRTNIIPSAPLAKMGETDDNNSKPSKWSALKIFLLVFLLIIICLGGIGAFFYMKQHRYHSSRLY
ncbi:unnamed protein product [Rotaria sp. Silwood2]|nr:unnamed protein product [Rotaria sp. Silwood2]CAF3945013.1 unnamed protein product [Rotaria sp. Silwood2]